MAHVLNPEQTESTPLNTELEFPTLEAPPEQSEPTVETTSNPEASFETTAHAAEQANSDAAPVAATAEELAPEHHDEPDLSMEDFAAALESFDREQAAEAAAQAFDD